MQYIVELAERAIDDLDALHLWVTQQASLAVADAYLSRVEERIRTLSTFAARGTPRDELAGGLRTLTFERRLLIAYHLIGERVVVLRIINAQRDLDGQFDD